MSDRTRRKQQKTLPVPDQVGGEPRSQREGEAWLTVVAGQNLGTRVHAAEGASIGRDPEAELCLDDPGVSWHHASLACTGGCWVIDDLESRNGTRVNGERICRRMLVSGDRLQLGSSVIRFEIQDPVDRAYGDAISHLLNVDELSGLYAPRRFKAELKLRLDRARTRGEPLALLVMDLDGVKAVNDRWGHAFGAHAIAETGRVIAARLDGKGFACRWGGDEFVAALPEYSGDSAEAIGDEIRRNVHGRRLQMEGVELSVEISIGVAEFPAQARDAESLFRAADQALYRAKRAGKNRVSR